MSTLVILGVAIVPQSVTTYNTVAASMFFFWDYLITFDDEVNFIWRQKQSYISALFYFIRYLTLAIRSVHLIFCANVFGYLGITAPDCTVWRWFQVLSGQILFCIVELLLITRIYALYEKSTKLLGVLLFFLLLEFSAMMALVITSLPKEVAKGLPPALAHIHSAPCIGISQPKEFASLWIPALIMQTTLSILVAWKVLRSGSFTGNRLLTIFVRDHLWAFLMIFGVAFWATLAYELTDDLGETALTWTYSVLGFAGTRLVLNLRGYTESTDEVLTSEISEINFSSVPPAPSSSPYIQTSDSSTLCHTMFIENQSSK
ncbi:hypothetical protein Clacol_004030 [Clathrus columnatus]|uniref:DUF6533 domain-containing protein n=1 Tax=Clathrus columnatus TaxID=1419009 RepID=A0AAV5A9X6_9AGAM|nr:hypothetical protein Clacol_004030 [Clathrus columnatus]